MISRIEFDVNLWSFIMNYSGRIKILGIFQLLEFLLFLFFRRHYFLFSCLFFRWRSPVSFQQIDISTLMSTVLIRLFILISHRIIAIRLSMQNGARHIGVRVISRLLPVSANTIIIIISRSEIYCLRANRITLKHFIFGNLVIIIF